MKLRLSTKEEIYQLFNDRAWNFFINHITHDVCGVAARLKGEVIKPDDQEAQQRIASEIGRWHKLEKTTLEQLWFTMAQECHQQARHIGGGNSPLDVSSVVDGQAIGYDIKSVKEHRGGKKTNEMSLSQNFQDNLDDIFRIFNERLASLAELDFKSFEQDDIVQAINTTVNERIARFTQKHGDETRTKFKVNTICMPVLVQDMDGLGYSLLMLQSDHQSPLSAGSLDVSQLYQNTKAAMFDSKGLPRKECKVLQTFPISLPCDIGGVVNKDVLRVDLYKSKKRIELRIYMDNIPDEYKLNIDINTNALLKIVSHNNMKDYSYSEFSRHISDQASLSEKNSQAIVTLEKPVSPVPSVKKTP